MIVHFEIKCDARASEALADLLEALGSLREDLPWRDEIAQAEEAVLSIANHMVIIQGGRIAGRFEAERKD